MDATNGITWVRGLTLEIVVIPEIIYVDGGEIQCLEGDSVELPVSLFTVRNNYYKGKIMDYRIFEKPKHGAIRFSRFADSVPSRFTRQQLDAGLIQVIVSHS